MRVHTTSRAERERQRQIRAHYVEAAAHTTPEVLPSAKQISGLAKPLEALLRERWEVRRNAKISRN